jgi:hypothetical protein
MSKRKYKKRVKEVLRKEDGKIIFDEEIEGEFLPRFNVMKIARNCIGTGAMSEPQSDSKLKARRGVRFSKDFQILLLKCVAEFMHMIAIKLRNKKTINDEDILFAMESLGINQYSTHLRLFMADYRQMVYDVSLRRSEELQTVPALTDPNHHS